jgi:hypothetical protein
MKYISPIKKIIVFSRWSGKGYAAFASLGKTIKIATVSVNISDQALSKNKRQSLSIDHRFCSKEASTVLLDGLRQTEGIPDAISPKIGLFLNCPVLFASLQKGRNEVRRALLKNQSPCFISIKHGLFYFK